MPNYQQIPSPRLMSLGHRIAALAAAHPKRPALISVDAKAHGHEILTWSGLDTRTAAVARALRLVLRPSTDQPILWVPAANRVGSIVSMLGALRAGMVVAGLDASAPAIDTVRSVAAIASAHGRVMSLDGLLGQSSENTAPARPGDSDAAVFGSWILMTGGSTGVPKPVGASVPIGWDPRHGPPLLLQHACWVPGQVQLVIGPLHHAAPSSSFLDGVLSGNTLVLTNGYYPQLLFDMIDEYQIEWAQLTPTHMRMADSLLASRTSQLRSLRAILHTAAPCPPDTKRRWIDALGPHRVFEMYAATESIGTTLCTGEEWLQRPGTVGRGFLTRIRVLDERRREVTPGHVGEVYMRSLRRPPPAGRYDGLCGFRSVGDHGHVDQDGYLYLRGRADDLVIIGGENVYLGDIESTLLAHAGVQDAAVVAVPDDMLHASLHAYVVPRDGARLDERTLQGHCRRQLPAAKRPRTIQLVDVLPRNAAGKLIRREVGSWDTT